jgi:nicotinate-nucleotide--dimethylbenzimidazole phosphoribosyltransferase
MGIGNTTAAAALLAAYTGVDPAEITGRGTGVGNEGLARKADAIRRALARSQPDRGSAIDVLSQIGGFEIGAIAGFVLGAAQARLPVVLDGFISSSAALLVKALDPGALDVVFFSHRSAERGHGRMLAYLDAEAYYSLDMRLGEGTGAALTINLLESALALYLGMATFGEAGVSDR